MLNCGVYLAGALGWIPLVFWFVLGVPVLGFWSPLGIWGCGGISMLIHADGYFACFPDCSRAGGGFCWYSDGKSYLVSSFYLRFLSFPLLSHRFSVRCWSMFLLVAWQLFPSNLVAGLGSCTFMCRSPPSIFFQSPIFNCSRSYKLSPALNFVLLGIF